MKVHGDISPSLELKEGDDVSVCSEHASRTTPPNTISPRSSIDRKPDISAVTGSGVIDSNNASTEIPKVNDWFVCHPRPPVNPPPKDHSHFPSLPPLPSFHPLPIMQYS